MQRKGHKISFDHLGFKMSITHLNGDSDRHKVGQRLIYTREENASRSSLYSIRVKIESNSYLANKWKQKGDKRIL